MKINVVSHYLIEKKGRFITFIKETKTLMLSANITMQELQAIYKKCQELWCI